MVALAANPITDPEAYNVVYFAGQPTPGVVRVSKAPRKFRWDIKDVAGSQGQTETYNGWAATDGIEVKVLMWRASQVDDFYARIQPLLWIDATKAPASGVAIYYPSLQANQITTVNVEEISELTPEGGMLWSVSVSLVEYRPAKAKNVSSTPNGGATKRGGSRGGPSQNYAALNQASPDPNQKLRDAVDKEFAIAKDPGVRGRPR